MDFVDQFFSFASNIYALVEKVKANKKRCHRVSDRVRGLEKLVKSIRSKKQTFEGVKEAMEGLSTTLETAEKLIGKYTKHNWVMHVLKAGSYGDEFDDLNNRLTDHFQILSGFMNVGVGDTLNQMFEKSVREQEDEADRREDDNQVQASLMDFQKKQQEKLDDIQKEVQFLTEKVLKVLVNLNKPSITETRRMIKPQELEYDEPKEPFMTTDVSQVYKGVYRGFPVAIKRYINPDTDPGVVRNIFDQEVEHMTQFESPYILRMFGICVPEEDVHDPEFFIIMEYCERGSLCDVVRKPGYSLSWSMKARMCLDAARGLYRLHQSENNTKLHGCISSSKFLVTEGYTVKLAGFELTKTETSMKKKSMDISSGSPCYYSPELLTSIKAKYNLKCEIYSFGIVMWEIATGLEPLKGMEDPEIIQKVGKENYKEELPEDCPKGLKSLINSCRNHDDFQRPSAGVLVDKLQSLVIQLTSAETLRPPASQ